MTMVLDLEQSLTCCAKLEDRTMAFISPELLAPQKFGAKNVFPTPESDIYAFGLVILLVCNNHRGCRLSTYTVQVLAGEMPYPNTGLFGIIFGVVEGLRPDRPANSSVIGLSDSLWDFVQRCWDHDVKSRPKIGEVVEHLAKEAAIWDRVMPPSEPWNDVCVSEPVMDSRGCCEFIGEVAKHLAKDAADWHRVKDRIFEPVPENQELIDETDKVPS